MKLTFTMVALLGITYSYAGSADESVKPAPEMHGTEREPIFAPIHPMADNDENVVGDPSQTGKPFVLRIRELPGAIAAPHTHTFDENITVVQGTWFFGIGDHFDASKLHKLPMGSFVFIPAGTPMFGFAPEGATVQVHGIGPFTQKFCHALVALDPIADDKTVKISPSSFRFHKDELVTSAHGAGRVRQGYATGDIVEYEIVEADGTVFIVQERDLQRRQ